MLQGKKILLAITGSIAAYKMATLTRLLVKEGAIVKIVMTPSACEFITPLTLSTLSKNDVVVSLTEHNTWTNHVMLGRWADAMLVAPASANTLAKMANGFCDNLLMATYLSATCPVFFAPAMDEDMWHHPATKANIQQLLSFGHAQIPVEKGELASGLFGEGRMAEPETMIAFLGEHFKQNAAVTEHTMKGAQAVASTDHATAGTLAANATDHATAGTLAANATADHTAITGRSGAASDQAVSTEGPLHGKLALVTAGPTVEAIDPVRYISNRSSGKMGIAIAEALADAGAVVKLVLGPTHITTTHAGITVIPVQSAADMFSACVAEYPMADVIVMAAAVADYRPAHVADLKIKKNEATLQIELEKTHDILRTLGNNKAPEQVLVGFSLETNNERENALKKLKEKNLDLVVLNSLADAGAGFDHDTNKVTLFDNRGKEQSLPLQSKTAVAREIVAAIIALQHA